MITIDETNLAKKNMKYKMAKIDLDFNKVLEEWVIKGIARSKTDATAKMVPIISNVKFNVRTIVPETKVRYIKNDRSKRRKVELELGVE